MENQNQNEGQNVQRNIFTQWLEKLQQESWQLELVISGLALYLVYEARVYIEDFAVYAEMYDYTALNPISFASDLFYGSWVIFIINLIVHILARGFWIGAIGLRYVSGEVDYKSLNYSEIFEKHLEKKVGRFDVYIEKLERFCSILYAYTFLLFFIFVSLMAYFGVFVLIISGVESLTDNLDSSDQGIFISMIALPYFLLGLIYGIDVVFMGGFKKVKDKTISISSLTQGTFNKLQQSFKVWVEDILGLQSNSEANSDKLKSVMQLLIDIRKEAKSKKDFATSDKIRNELANLGIQINDEKDGNMSFTFL